MEFQQFSGIYDFQRAFPTEQVCMDYLERIRWGGQVVSPFSPQGKVYKCLGGKYRCKDTKKYFTVRTGTIFANSNLPLTKWMVGIFYFTTHTKGISSVQLAKDLGIRQKAAWFMLHKMRYAVSQKGFFNFPLRGVIESDTAFIGGKEGNKHFSKRKYPRVDEKAAVIGMVERGGRVVMRYITTHNNMVVVPLLAKNVASGSQLMTDEGHEFAGAYRHFEHRTIVHRLQEYVHGDVYTNTIEGVWSHLKRTIGGTYHTCSKKHLQAYLEEFCYRHNHRKDTTYTQFTAFFDHANRGSLKWADLTGKGVIQ